MNKFFIGWLSTVFCVAVASVLIVVKVEAPVPKMELPPGAVVVEDLGGNWAIIDWRQSRFLYFYERSPLRTIMTKID